MDMYFFGLVNEIVFLNNHLDPTKKDTLHKELNAKIEAFKLAENHKDNPNALKYLKPRIADSLNIYKKARLKNG